MDPPKPVVIPQFSPPPDGLSPASVGMLYKGRFLDDLVTASIVNLSVKGYIRIEEVIEKGGAIWNKKGQVLLACKTEGWRQLACAGGGDCDARPV